MLLAALLIAVTLALSGTACGSLGQRLGGLVGREHFGPSWTADGESIVFGYRYGASGVGVGEVDSIYLVSSDGAGLRKLIPQDAQPDNAAAFDYSPDIAGSKIAFATLRYVKSGDREYEIATANLDGSDYRRLIDSNGSDLAPAWSPDGKHIAFVSNRAGFASKENDQVREASFNVYVMDADGSNVWPMAPRVFISLYQPPSPPKWSPDGDYLAFRSGYHLYTARFAGVPNFLGLTRTDPAWSPDGQWIAFSHREPIPETAMAATIYITRPDGSEARRVVHLPGGNPQNLSWSPDGSALRFSSDIGGYKEVIHRIGIDGSGLQQIAEIDYGSQIAWSPDDSRIVVSRIGATFYYSIEPRDALLYTMASDGSDRRVLVRVGDFGAEAANGG